ncbi:MAG: hypothetical protein K2I69_02710 [Muribaculaceae bacterium]|nr:hypothetical protein [Muribaculaceae bacterium]
MAKSSIYDGAQHIGQWRGFDVYEPTFADNEPRFIGFPQFIICKHDKCRWGDDEPTSREIMRALSPEND